MGLSPSTYDLIVIGGGPAGASAAITAAREGASVLLLERGSFPRHKVCGEFVSAESLDLLGGFLGARHAPLLSTAIRIPQARLFFDGSTLQTPIDPPAASIARLDLDATLWEVAEEYGVQTQQQTAVQDVTGTGPFRITTSAGEFSSLAVINATGRWSNLRAKQDDTVKPQPKWLGIKMYFAETSPRPSADLYFFEGGYCGVQPVAFRNSYSEHGQVNACAMVHTDVASNLTQVFAQHPALAERAGRWRSLSNLVSTFPLFFRDPQPVRDNVLQVGDSAGFVDPFVGDGISLALRSGSLAGESLIPFFRGEASLEHATQQYCRAYGRRFAPVFRTSSKIRRMLRMPRPVRRTALFMLQRAPGITRYLVSKTR
jgi:flavin-dependent dehydrogenase